LKENGLWYFINEVCQLTIPTELINEFSKFEGAAEFFNTINNLSKRNLLR